MNRAGKGLGGRSVAEEIVGDGRRLYGRECGGLCRTVTGELRKYGVLRKISCAAGKVWRGVVQLAKDGERGGGRQLHRCQVRARRRRKRVERGEDERHLFSAGIRRA